MKIKFNDTDIEVKLHKITDVILNRECKTYDIEVEDAHCFTAKNPVDGSEAICHNSAMISLSNLSDDRMRHAKSGAWWEGQGQRALANNSACYTERPDVGIFMQEWQSLYESKSGERGIFNREAAKNIVKKNGRRDSDYEFGTNPCSEIILRPFQFCNLTEIIVRADDTIRDVQRKARIASILGTIQSTLTHFPYLRKIWRDNTEAERLLGVSMTGVLDNALLNNADDPELEGRLQSIKQVAIDVNKEFAEAFGIPQSAAITCNKPSGCTTLDTEIMTNAGTVSMKTIFSDNGFELEDLLPLDSGTWIDVKSDKQYTVVDENGNDQTITKLYVNGMQPVYEIEFDDGKIYKFTGNHKLKTAAGWKRVDELTVNDEILTVQSI